MVLVIGITVLGTREISKGHEKSILGWLWLDRRTWLCIRSVNHKTYIILAKIIIKTIFSPRKITERTGLVGLKKNINTYKDLVGTNL